MPVREKFAHTLARFETTIRATAPKEIHKVRLWVERVSLDVTRNPRMITTIPTAALLDFSVVFAEPLPHLPGDVPACVVPDDEKGLLANSFEPLAAPREKPRTYATEGSAVDEHYPYGRSVNICDAILRAEAGRPGPEVDGTLRLRIELSPTAHRFKRNHQLRLQLSSGAHPRYARNTGSGEPLAIATRLVPADQEVLHDPEHPSSVILTVLN